MRRWTEAETDEASALIHNARFELALVSARRDITRMKAALANWRLKHVLDAFQRSLSRHAYNPTQPRVPAGNPDGGQWTSVLGGFLGPGPAGEAGMVGAETIDIAADGHHFVPRALFQNENLTPETRRVFEDAETGRLSGGPHYFDGPHRAYNAAVAERYAEFLNQRGLRSEDLTPAQARQFADSIRNSPDPRIRDFNLYVYRREVWYWIRRLRLRE